MDVLLRLVFALGCVATAVGAWMFWVLSDRPRTWQDHARALLRYAIMGGGAFAALDALKGWQPPLATVVLAASVGLAMVLHARENHMLALTIEKLGTSDGSST
jgi:hypothetical protein